MRNNKQFSLIELIAVIAVLAIVIVTTFQFYSSIENVWKNSESSRSVAEDARIALDMISRDLENSYYGDGAAPFWHWQPADTSNPPAAWGDYRNELIAFVSSTPVPPNGFCLSEFCEIKYQKHFSTSHDAEEGWLNRSVTGDRNSDNTINNKWNYFNNLTVSYGDANSAFSVNSSSFDEYQKLIPYVIDLSFYCYYTNGDLIPPDSNTSTPLRIAPANSFPYSITISITLMDHLAWQKWIGLQGSSVYPNETPAAKTFRENNQQTFMRTVLIGDRGQ